MNKKLSGAWADSFFKKGILSGDVKVISLYR